MPLILTIAGQLIAEIPNIEKAIAALEQAGLLTAEQVAAARIANAYSEQDAVKNAEVASGTKPV
jgi:hypothetical protein